MGLFPLAADDDDEFDDVCDCNLPGPALNKIGGGSGIGAAEPKGAIGGSLGGAGIEPIPGGGGGGGPKIKFHLN